MKNAADNYRRRIDELARTATAAERAAVAAALGGFGPEDHVPPWVELQAWERVRLGLSKAPPAAQVTPGAPS